MVSICGYIDLYLFATSVQCLKLDYFLKFSRLGRFGKMLAVIKCRVFCIGNRYYLPGSSNSYFFPQRITWYFPLALILTLKE